MVKKFMVEKSGVEKFMVEMSGVEKSGVEKFLLALGLNCLVLKLGVEKSGVEMSCNRQTIITSEIHDTHLLEIYEY